MCILAPIETPALNDTRTSRRLIRYPCILSIQKIYCSFHHELSISTERQFANMDYNASVEKFSTDAHFNEAGDMLTAH